MRAILVAILLTMLPIVSFGANPNSRDKDGMTPLMEAASKGDLEQVKKLVAAASKVNDKDKTGMTPLMYGAMRGTFRIPGLEEDSKEVLKAQRELSDKTHSDVVEFLIKNGAKLQDKDINGQTAIFWAVQSGQTRVLNLLIDKGADLAAKTKRGDTAIGEAAFLYQEDKKHEMMKILGVKPNSNEPSQISPDKMTEYTK